MEDVAVIGGLIGVQFVYAGNALLLSYLMSLGLESLTIVTFTSFATFLILLPFAFYFERFISFSLCIFLLLGCNFIINTFCRCKWPTKVGFKLLAQLFLLALGGYANLMTNFSISILNFHLNLNSCFLFWCKTIHFFLINSIFFLNSGSEVVFEY